MPLVAIAGGSCAGKTTLARAVARSTGAAVVSLDDYFGDPATFPTECGHPDYDRVEAIDWNRVFHDVTRLKGRNVVVEGFLALAHPVLRSMYDDSFFIGADPVVMTQRRLKREPETPEAYISEVVADRYVNVVMPTRRYASSFIDGFATHKDAVAVCVPRLPRGFVSLKRSIWPGARHKSPT